MKNILLQKQIVLLICIFALAFLVACQRTTPEVDTQEELMDYYKEIYGEDCVIQLPRGEYCRVYYPDDNNSNASRYTIMPLTASYELYTGDIFTCYPENKINKAGSEIGIIIAHNDNGPWHSGDDFLLEILVDEQWYPLNPYWYYTDSISPETNTIRYPLNGTFGYSLGRVSSYTYNEDSKKYEYVDVRDRTAVYMRPGHYRYSKFVSDPNQSYRIFCEFDVVQ